ncbi:MAG: 3-oxoadipate enol-lactonase [Variibacter sp.]|nr:3-oxoadipate enol-lactonase [Variibacter sp.]
MQHFTASDGLRLAYTVDDFTDPWLKPATLLLLHAAMGHSGRYYAWVPMLSRRYRVVRLDLRGHGQSQVPRAELPLTMERLVQDTAELLDHLGCESAHIVGNSAGGYIAQNLAMRSPERVRSLMLFGSTPGLKHSQAATWLPRVAKEGLRNFLADTIADRFPIERTDPRHIEWFLDEAAKNDVPFIARFIGLMTTLDWSDRLAEIRCPTLVVYPGAETVGTTRAYDAMRELISDVEMVSYEGMPHNICDSLPDRCVEDVLAFLRWRFGLPEEEARHV